MYVRTVHDDWIPSEMRHRVHVRSELAQRELTSNLGRFPVVGPVAFPGTDLHQVVFIALHGRHAVEWSSVGVARVARQRRVVVALHLLRVPVHAIWLDHFQVLAPVVPSGDVLHKYIYVLCTYVNPKISHLPSNT